jgi:putative Holliday junction resolvase
MRVLGLDVGSRTIGLAVSDDLWSIAMARGVLERAGHVEDAKKVARWAASESVSVVVVGLPLELDGREGRRVRAVRSFIAALRQEFDSTGANVTIETWDERFSSAAAERTLLEADLSRAKRKQKIDQMAAQFILQGWLDSRQNPMLDPQSEQGEP